jgi:TrmH family RNA methyltransferase
MALSQGRTRLIGRLSVRKTREREGLVLVEGVRAATEALDGGAAVSLAVVSPRLESTEAGARLVQRLEGAVVERVDDAELATLADTQTPQGVLLVCRQPSTTLEALDGARFLVLDAVQDPGNVGTLVRGAVAFALDGVICLDGTVDPWGAKAVRASAGTVFRLPVVPADAASLVPWLAARGVPLLVADAGGEDAQRRAGAERFALAVGNEGEGVRAALRAAAEAVVAVPMAGPTESLNAGVAGSILMHTLAMARGAS